MRNIFSILVTIIVLAAPLPSTADGDADKIFRVREAFFYNFLKFIAWPEAHSLQKNNEVNICIIGDQPFAKHFLAQYIGRKELKLNIRDLTSYNDIRLCHILFIGKAAEEHLSPILSLAQHHSVLTVSEISNFADQGGIIELVQVGRSVGLFSKDKINLRINVREAMDSGLAFDARLLQIAAEVLK